ncbi:MAG: hypothetical protein DRQ49_12790 [Gammaproteobacteria bacterium]|nr:MAG: hypothetical protein DRQ49_12790 [Gammaproteobacteria bacterium]RKZ41973.1 MAG: hypothetical protein DRQ41_07585 [Gammaproteobacteria bacterium]RKZ73022.1 MAG: hypothetical protein DRQ57_15685 [Gammaproteobacteria bacterium]
MNDITTLLLIALLGINTAQATEPLKVTPKQIWSKASQVHNFKVTGGLPPIYWQTKAGDVQVGEKPNTFVYTAPRRYMQDTIRFYDRTDQAIEVTIDVLRPLSVTPSRRNIPLQGESHFRIQGGSGQWQAKMDDDALTITQLDKGKLTVKASDIAGLQQIQISDKVTQEQVEVEVQIYAPLEVQEE